jgi:hypothetical protein
MRRQIGAAGGSRVDQPGNRREIRTVGNLLAEDLDRAADNGEDIVEVMAMPPVN